MGAASAEDNPGATVGAAITHPDSSIVPPQWWGPVVWETYGGKLPILFAIG